MCARKKAWCSSTAKSRLSFDMDAIEVHFIPLILASILILVTLGGKGAVWLGFFNYSGYVSLAYVGLIIAILLPMIGYTVGTEMIWAVTWSVIGIIEFFYGLSNLLGSGYSESSIIASALLGFFIASMLALSVMKRGK